MPTATHIGDPEETLWCLASEMPSSDHLGSKLATRSLLSPPLLLPSLFVLHYPVNSAFQINRKKVFFISYDSFIIIGKADSQRKGEAEKEILAHPLLCPGWGAIIYYWFISSLLLIFLLSPTHILLSSELFLFLVTLLNYLLSHTIPLLKSSSDFPKNP